MGLCLFQGENGLNLLTQAVPGAVIGSPWGEEGLLPLAGLPLEELSGGPFWLHWRLWRGDHVRRCVNVHRISPIGIRALNGSTTPAPMNPVHPKLHGLFICSIRADLFFFGQPPNLIVVLTSNLYGSCDMRPGGCTQRANDGSKS